MKRSIILFSMLFALQTVLAQTPYFRAGVGISSLPDAKYSETESGVSASTYSFEADVEYDSSIGLCVAFGLACEDGVKLEGVFSTQENEGTIDVEGTKLKLDQETRTLGINAIKEFDGERVVPFINVGLGFVFSELKIPGVSIKDANLSFNIGGGVTHAISETLNLYGSYNYYMIRDGKDSYTVFDSTYDAELELGLHQFVVGITQSF